MNQDAKGDLGLIEQYPRAPVKRAAYSDRTAWLMAVLAELAYIRFDQDKETPILSLARELAELTDQDEIARGLKGLATLLGAVQGPEREGGNAALREALAVGGFELKGVLFDAHTDTQGYVAVKDPGRRSSGNGGAGVPRHAAGQGLDDEPRGSHDADFGYERRDTGQRAPWIQRGVSFSP